MTEIVLRVRLTGGDRIDVVYEDPDLDGVEELIERALTTLANDGGVLRTRHGNRLIALFSRGVAAVEVAPRGAIV